MTKAPRQSHRAPPLFSGEQKVIQLRLPVSLLQKLESSADANCRSMAQEIQYRVLRDLKANEND
jgi:Arc-like DNA binding dprotein